MGRPSNAELTSRRLMGLFASYLVVFSSSVVASSFTGAGKSALDLEATGDAYTSTMQAKKTFGIRLNLKKRNFGQTLHPDQDVEGADSQVQLNAYFRGALYRSGQRLKNLEKRVLANLTSDGSSNFEGSKADSSYKSNTYSIQGEYVADFQLGSPSQSVKLILDTGSDLVWVVAGQSYYDKSSSSTYEELGCSDSACAALPSTQCQNDACTYYYQYGDGSAASGVLSQESVELPLDSGSSQSKDDFKFGYTTNFAGNFANSEGLLGLGLGELSFATQVGDLFGNQFSYCLVNWNAPATQASPLFFGKSATDSISASDSEITYTSFITNTKLPSFYYLGLDSISVGGTDVSIPAGTFDIQSSGYGGFLIDSGTTLTYLVADAYAPLLQAFQSLVSYPTVAVGGIDLCYDVSAAATPSFPSLVLTFTGGAKLDLPQDNYMIKATNSDTILCLALAQSSQLSILGNLEQQNYHFVYDRQSSRLGWTGPVECGSQ